ncbi:MAG: hypothetical protein GXO25_05175 [Euryarchaeota archaeon]|nr:hypothetical protein [Euryarchaeota archaeon]
MNHAIEWEPGFWVRPDGCTLSMTEEDAKKFVDKYSDSIEHPAGAPVPVYIAPELYEEMKSKEYGTIWVSRSEEAKFVKERKLIYTEKRGGWVFRELSGMDNDSKQ